MADLLGVRDGFVNTWQTNTWGRSVMGGMWGKYFMAADLFGVRGGSVSSIRGRYARGREAEGGGADLLKVGGADMIWKLRWIG